MVEIRRATVFFENTARMDPGGDRPVNGVVNVWPATETGNNVSDHPDGSSPELDAVPVGPEMRSIHALGAEAIAHTDQS